MWDLKKQEEIEMPFNVELFLKEIEAVCRKHNLSIGHEDYQGAFKIEEFDESNIEWLQSAHLNL